MQIRGAEMLVGAFILAGLGALAFLAVQVSGFNVAAQTGTYSVYADFSNVSGLSVRSEVTIAGVHVGQVSAIAFDEADYEARVRMEIDRDIDTIPVDSTATILTDGLLGRKYIGISIGAEEEYLQPGGVFWDTQDAVVLEDLIGQFLRRQ